MGNFGEELGGWCPRQGEGHGVGLEVNVKNLGAFKAKT